MRLISGSFEANSGPILRKRARNLAKSDAFAVDLAKSDRLLGKTMALQTGIQAPDFTLQNTEADEVSLSDYKGTKNVVLLFFPLAYSSICTKELCTIRDNMKLYEVFDAEILAISVDSFFTLREFKKSENLNFSLLSDFNKEVSQKYDALNSNYYGMKGVAKRSAYVIDKQGTIKYAQVLEDASLLPDFDAIQQTLQKLS